MIRGMLFDKDGTLFEFSASWDAWAAEVFAGLAEGDADRLSRIADAARFDLGASAFQPDSPVIAGTLAEVAALLTPHVPQMSEAALADHLDQTATGATMQEAVPLGPFLDGLRGRGISCGVATNDSEAAARAHLAAAGVEDRLDFIAGYDSGHGGKPAPGQCLAFLASRGFAPGECAMVGDSLHDLMAGRAAGMQTVGVLTGLAPKSVLEPFADIVLPDIGHVFDWLDGVGSAH